MNFRRLTQLALVCSAFCATATAQVNPGSSFLFHLPVPSSGGTRVLGYLANTSDLNPDLDVNGPANPSQILTTPDGSRAYLVSNGALQVFSSNLQTLQTVSGVAGPIKNLTITPDGKYLLIAGAQFYILNTNTNAVVSTNLGTTGTVMDIAVSPDSKTAWALQVAQFFNGITPIDLTTLTAGPRVNIQRAFETITYSQGRVYVPSRNVIAEYDSKTLAFVRETVMQALPGRMQFNLSGTKAYFIDYAELQGFSIVSFDAVNGTTRGWPADPTNRPVFDEIFVAGPGRVLALERARSTLWEISDNPLNAVPASMAGFDSSIVFGAAISNEIPSATHLFVLTENSARPTLARVNLASGALDVFSNAAVPTGALKHIGIPVQTGASQITKYNDSQTLNEGGVAKTLIGYVTDPLGRPVHNLPVSFTTDNSSTATITNASERTNSQGYVEATVTVPNVGGTYTITLNAGGASGAYTITVPITGGGGGGGGGINRMTIVRGDGMLLGENDAIPIWSPMTVKIVDAQGAPQGGVQVDFSILQGGGYIFPVTVQTNEDGLAASYFTAPDLSSQFAYVNSTVLATSNVGSVEFSEVTYRKADDPRYVPISTETSSPDRANVRRGDVTPGLFSVLLRSTGSPQVGEPISGYTIRVAHELDYTVDSDVGSCVNNTRAENGIGKCDFKTSCSLESATRVQFVVGGVFLAPMVLIPEPGAGRKITYLSGDNQSANIGLPIADRLVAKVTDNCGDPVTGARVTWTVTQGSATITGAITQSDTSGRVSAGVTMGQSTGPIKVTLATEGAPVVVFTLQATVTVSSISLVSGGGQSVLPGENFPSPVIFVLRTSNGNAVGANLTVNFALTGSGLLGNTSATTNELGQVQTTVTAGSNPGPLTVTAAYSNLSASASLTVRPPTLPITAASFSNAASGATGLVPCGLATVVGNGLAPNPVFLSGIGFGPLPYQLGTIDSLRINNVPAPIQAVSNQNGKQQVNFQVPCETAVGSATVAITVNGVVTTVSGVPVLQGQPGIFTYAGPNGKIYGAVIRVKDGSYITPSNLAPTGENFYLILTGLGLVTPNTTTNSAGNNQAVNLATIVGVNNGGVPTQTARYLQGQIGVYYVEFTIPQTSTAAPGTVLLTDTPLAAFVTVNGQPVFSQPGVSLPGVVQGAIVSASEVQ